MQLVHMALFRIRWSLKPFDLSKIISTIVRFDIVRLEYLIYFTGEPLYANIKVPIPKINLILSKQSDSILNYNQFKGSQNAVPVNRSAFFYLPLNM